MKLGKHPPRLDPRTLRLARYLTAALPPPPATVDFTQGLGALGMMLNDTLGDCTCAGAAHMIQAWTGAANPPAVVLPDSAVLQAYEQFCGYNPADPSTDQGGVEIDVLNDWRQIGVGGRKITAFAAVNHRDHNEVMQALSLFGGLYLGVALPLSAQSQVESVWDLVSDPTQGAPGSWGGHCVPVVAATLSQPSPNYAQDRLTVVTWGALQKMTWDFWDAYVDECYAVLSPDWLAQNGSNPAGLDLAQLQADLAQIT